MYDLISTINPNHGPTSTRIDAAGIGAHARRLRRYRYQLSHSVEREREGDWKALDDLSYLDGIVEIRREKTLASALRRWLNSTLTFDAICEEVNRNDTVR